MKSKKTETATVNFSSNLPDITCSASLFRKQVSNKTGKAERAIYKYFCPFQPPSPFAHVRVLVFSLRKTEPYELRIRISGSCNAETGINIEN